MAMLELGSDAPEDQDEAIVTYLELRVSSGDTLLRVAKDIGERLGIEVRRGVVSKYLENAAERMGRVGEGGLLARARARGADALADEALDIVDNAPATREGIQLAIARAAQRKWQAEKQNPAEYGQSKGPSVTISIGSLHLDALRQRVIAPRIAIAGAIEQSEEIVSDYEVVS